MRSSTYVALFAGSTAAQSSIALFNPFPYQVSPTVTQVGADAAATTYKNNCPANNAGVSVIPDYSRLRSSQHLSPTPAPTPAARLARRQALISDTNDYTLCEPFTIKQGASTWALNFKDPLPGAWTVDMNCKWQGAMTSADLTCTVTQDGSMVPGGMGGTTTTVLPKSQGSEIAEIFQTYAVVSGSGAVSAGASQTASGARSASPTPGASGASVSGTATASRSTGLGAAGPLPTGAIKFAGGAAGLVAAALVAL
ncbi:hypothetical protein GQ44DRAFT_614426 [Phaeosphaeriaceae sp. PMI808]|nr:hypothetical protein GQ44DRAFT_614426 [Phaeosphaeriaceae sp. PMI808]